MADEISVEVLVFARLREACGNRSTIALRLPAGADAELCFRRLCEDLGVPESHREGLVVAINEEYGSWAQRLADGDRVGFIPPVSGGGA